MREAHNGGLMGHFGVEKTLEILEEQFYWPRMNKDVARIVANVLSAKEPSHGSNPTGCTPRCAPL